VTAAQTAEKKLSPVVETKEGPVQGFISNSVTTFLGIPYAEPPVGNLRWRPPKDRAPWTNVRNAAEFAPICALTTTLGVFSGPPNNNEDCLYLNVFTPDLNPSARLPVIVWIHGGGNVDGETPGYDGSKLASQGKTVVVTMEYRLNLMGFLAHPALDNEGHLFGNYVQRGRYLHHPAAFRCDVTGASWRGGCARHLAYYPATAAAVRRRPCDAAMGRCLDGAQSRGPLRHRPELNTPSGVHRLQCCGGGPE